MSEDTSERPSEGITEAAITFVASLAGANTSAKWLSVGHDGDCKVTLECDASQLAQVLRLAVLGGQLLNVQVTAG